MGQEIQRPPVFPLDECRFQVGPLPGMRVPGIVYADEAMMKGMIDSMSLLQVANVAHLPGIVRASLAMPDIHWGYGFPIGGVAAFDPDAGVISPGGVGYDINCGVRLLRSGLGRDDVKARMKDLVAGLFRDIPTGVGSHRKDLRLDPAELRRVLSQGAGWAVSKGYGGAADLDYIEERGRIQGADPSLVSERAVERGRNQLGTLGSGNHFVEVGAVEEIYDEAAARVLGLAPGGVTVIIHTGSRGLGYQVCDDFIAKMIRAAAHYGIALPDRQLCCAPLGSPEGKQYLGAMAAAANFAFANRQVITAFVRRTFEEVLGIGPREVGLSVVYDVCHNIAKFEEHEVNGEMRRLCVHRKGATRAFPPGHPETPAAYRKIGQPVLIPGDMGRYSYVLVGTEKAYRDTFGSTCHGAGRLLSRGAARKAAKGRPLVREMEDRGIIVRSEGRTTLMEEISEAY